MSYILLLPLREGVHQRGNPFRGISDQIVSNKIPYDWVGSNQAYLYGPQALWLLKVCSGKLSLMLQCWRFHCNPPLLSANDIGSRVCGLEMTNATCSEV